MSALKKIALSMIVADIVWAVIMATFGANLITHLGHAAGGDPGLTVVSGLSGWILTFVIALFQGGIFMVVGSVFFTIGMLGYSKLPPAGKTVVHWALVADIVWAVTVASFGTSMFAQVLGVAGAGGATTVEACLLWFIAFVIAYIQGLIFMTVGSGFLFVILLVGVAIFKGDNKGRPNNDRNPGEPPHR